MLPGQVYVSSAGNLPCQHIAHTVCSKVGDKRGEPETEMFAAINAAMQQAPMHRVKTVAIPASYGDAYGIPRQTSAEIIVNSLAESIKDAGRLSPDSVYIVAEDDIGEVEAFVKPLNEIKPLELAKEEGKSDTGKVRRMKNASTLRREGKLSLHSSGIVAVCLTAKKNSGYI